MAQQNEHYGKRLSLFELVPKTGLWITGRDKNSRTKIVTLSQEQDMRINDALRAAYGMFVTTGKAGYYIERLFERVMFHLPTRHRLNRTTYWRDVAYYFRLDTGVELDYDDLRALVLGITRAQRRYSQTNPPTGQQFLHYVRQTNDFFVRFEYNSDEAMEILVEQEIWDRAAHVFVKPPRVVVPWVSFHGLDVDEVTTIFDGVKLDDSDNHANSDLSVSGLSSDARQTLLNSVRELLDAYQQDGEAENDDENDMEEPSKDIAEDQDVEMTNVGVPFMSQQYAAHIGNAFRSDYQGRESSVSQALQKRPGTKRSATVKAPMTYGNTTDVDEMMTNNIVAELLAEMKTEVEAEKTRVAKQIRKSHGDDRMDVDEDMSEAVEGTKEVGSGVKDADEGMKGAEDSEDAYLEDCGRTLEEEFLRDQGIENINEHDATKNVAGLPAMATNTAIANIPTSSAPLIQPVSDFPDDESEVSEDEGEARTSHYFDSYNLQPRLGVPLFNPRPLAFRPRKPGHF